LTRDERGGLVPNRLISNPMRLLADRRRGGGNNSLWKVVSAGRVPIYLRRTVLVGFRHFQVKLTQNWVSNRFLCSKTVDHILFFMAFDVIIDGIPLTSGEKKDCHGLPWTG